jgi:hypothetical protein
MNERADINVYFCKYLLCIFQEKNFAEILLYKMFKFNSERFFALHNISILYSYPVKKLFKKMKLFPSVTNEYTSNIYFCNFLHFYTDYFFKIILIIKVIGNFIILIHEKVV